jgi:hypothetical protein
MKSKVLSIALTLIALFAFGTAQAQNVHFTDVVVSEDGLTVTGKVAGLGNKYTGQQITITYGAELTVARTCYNPGNGNQVSGQSNSTQVVTATQHITITAKNGNVNFVMNLDPVSVPSPACPAGLIQGEGVVVEAGAKSLSFSVGTASGTIEL